MNARATARAHSREERRARSGARVPPMPACAARGMVQRVKISPPSQGLMPLPPALGARVGSAATASGRASGRASPLSAPGAYRGRATPPNEPRSARAGLERATRRCLPRSRADSTNGPRRISKCPKSFPPSELAIDPRHRVVAIAFRRRRCVVEHNAGHRGMGCVLSSERSADDFGADSRTMLARPKVRVASPPPDGRSLGTRHVTAGAFSPTRLFVAFRAARLAPPRPYTPPVSRRRRTRFRAARDILSSSIPTAHVRFPSLSRCSRASSA